MIEISPLRFAMLSLVNRCICSQFGRHIQNYLAGKAVQMCRGRLFSVLPLYTTRRMAEISYVQRIQQRRSHGPLCILMPVRYLGSRTRHTSLD